MPQNQTMTLDEKLTISNKALALMEFFTRYNWNLSEVEAEFEPDFLSK